MGSPFALMIFDDMFTSSPFPQLVSLNPWIKWQSSCFKDVAAAKALFANLQQLKSYSPDLTDEQLVHSPEYTNFEWNIHQLHQ